MSPSSIAPGVWSWRRATAVIDNPYFTRMTPVRWWDYPTLVLTVILTAGWVGIQGRRKERPAASTSGILSAVGSALAIGCPVCNKVVVGLLGVSGALGIWAPIQPVLAVLSVAALLTAVIFRWRGRGCDGQSCMTPATDSIDEAAAPVIR